MGRPVKKNLIASNESSVALSFQLGFFKTPLYVQIDAG